VPSVGPHLRFTTPALATYNTHFITDMTQQKTAECTELCHQMQQESQGVASNKDSNYNLQPELASLYDGSNILF
jgi:hypothetical protein